jgi:peptidoglycan/LPS O-acetylase OafA/YrhL
MENATSKKAAHNLSYFKSFDGIRGFSCLLILLLHYRFTKYNMPAYVAYFGLHSFFIMSSYLITKTLMKDIERTDSMWECLKIYCFKRFVRTFPLYFFYLALLIPIYFLSIWLFKSDFGLLMEFKKFGAMLLTFTYNYRETIQYVVDKKFTLYTILTPHLWSMSFEEQFYIVFFFFLFFTPRKFLKPIGIAMLIIIPLVRAYGYWHMLQHTNDHRLISLILSRNAGFQIDTFFYGILLALVKIERKKVWIYLAVTLGVVMLFLMLYTSYLTSVSHHIPMYVAIREDDYYYLHYGYLYLDVLANCFCISLFAAVIAYPDKITIFTNRILVEIGILTYNLYIFQFLFIPFGMIAAKLLSRKMPVLLAEFIGLFIYLALLYGFSKLTFAKFENPILQWKDKYILKFYQTHKLKR